MKLFLDSSAFAKRFIAETGSDKVEAFCIEASGLGLSILCFPEVISAFNRKRREKDLTVRRYTQLKERLFDDARDADIVQITPQIVATATILLEKNVLRAIDALHVACAIEWQADLFVTSDKRQCQAAKKAKLKCKLV